MSFLKMKFFWHKIKLGIDFFYPPCKANDILKTKSTKTKSNKLRERESMMFALLYTISYIKLYVKYLF